MSISDVDEHERPEVPHAMHPSEEHDFLADVVYAEGTARVCARKIAKWLDVHAVSSLSRFALRGSLFAICD
jgi:hypothetical protein